MSESDVGKTYQRIKDECSESGISLSELCRKADVNRSLIERWKLKDPKSIEILEKLESALNELKTKKTVQND